MGVRFLELSGKRVERNISEEIWHRGSEETSQRASLRIETRVLREKKLRRLVGEKGECWEHESSGDGGEARNH